MQLVPAYGRDYKSAKEVKADWDAGKDFEIADIFGGNAGRKINKAQAPKSENLFIRYKKLTQVWKVK